MSEPAQDKERDYKGVISRLESDGFGVVKFDDYDSSTAPSAYGTFHEPRYFGKEVCAKLRMGLRVKGEAEKFGEAYRIITLTIDE